MKDSVNPAALWRFGVPQTPRVAAVMTVVVMLCLGLWWEFGGLEQSLFTTPSKIFVVMITDHERILSSVFQSGRYVIFGVIAGGMLGFLVGLTAAVYNRTWLTLFTFSVILIGYPKTAVFLLFVGHYGVLSDGSLYAMTFYNVMIFMIFMVMRTTRSVLVQASSPRLEVAVQLFATRFETVWYCLVPQVLPVAVTSCAYISLGLWPFLIFAEPAGSPGVSGIGNYVFNAFQTGWWEHLYAGATAIALAGMLTVAIVLAIGRVLSYE